MLNINSYVHSVQIVTTSKHFFCLSLRVRELTMRYHYTQSLRGVKQQPPYLLGSEANTAFESGLAAGLLVASVFAEPKRCHSRNKP